MLWILLACRSPLESQPLDTGGLDPVAPPSLLVWADGGRHGVIHPDGRVVELTPFEDTDAQVVRQAGDALVSLGRDVVSTAEGMVVTAWLQAHDLDGGLNWGLELVDVYPSAIYVDSDGTVYVDRGWVDLDYAEGRENGWRVGLSGDVQELDGMWPVGPAVDGALPVCSDENCGFLVGDEVAWTAPPHAQTLDGELVYATETEWVRVSPEGERRLETGRAMSAVGAGGPVHLLRDVDRALWLADDQLTPLALAPGLELLDDVGYCGPAAPTLTAGGRPVVPLHDGRQAQHWVEDTTLGQPVTDFSELYIESAGATWAITASTRADTYCAPREWGDSDALSGDSIQILGPDATWLFRDVDRAALSPDGLEAVLFREDAARFDVLTGAEEPIEHPGRLWGWVPQD